MNAITAAPERPMPRAGHDVLHDRALRWAALLDRVAGGDDDALATLYDETSSVTYGLVMHILQDQQAAEDALIDLYMQVREQASVRPAGRDALSWLIELARHAALSRRQPGNPSQVPAPLPSLCATPLTSVTRFEPLHRERRQALTALERLTPRQRSIVELTYFGGLSAKQVAGQLRLSPEDVRREISTAMRVLRECQSTVRAD